MSDNKKTKKIENFIGVYDNYFSENMIDAFVDIYKNNELSKNVYLRSQYQDRCSSEMKDTMVPLPFSESHTWLQKVPGFPENLMMAYQEYLKEVPLNTYLGYENLHFQTVKIQKTSPGEGYHVWHVEAGFNYEMLQRVVAYTVYLNDIKEGGETEFLYQHTRVKPKKGRLVIWPAMFPFVHRGNPPLKEDKYILTSWLNGQFKI